MSWASITDAWIGELTSTVPGLQPEAVVVHRYASWSVELASATVGERHLAIWPQSEAESAEGFTTAPADLITQSYAVMVWEDASADTTRLRDDDEANLAWLELHEAIRARFYESTNIRLGDSQILRTHYEGTTFERTSGKRMMALQFTVTVPKGYV